MTTYWLDPFLEATTQGNGTTDTTTQDGTYAAPFSITGFYNTGSLITSVNSVTLSDGDEVRIKGLPFSTLFESKGNVYTGSSGGNTVVNYQPVTGNTSFDATISTTSSSIFAFQSSDLSTYLTDHAHPVFMASMYYSTSSILYTNLGNFSNAVIDLQLGYDSASDTGIELFRLKDTYANPRSFGTDYSYAFGFTNKVKLTAGWTSETAQEGYSIYEGYNETSYRYMRINYSNSKTHFDCERLVCCLAPRASGGTNNSLGCWGHYSTDRGEATDHIFPMFIGSAYRGDGFYGPAYAGDTGVYPYICGSGDASSDDLFLYLPNPSGTTSITTTFKNILIVGELDINNGNNYSIVKLGSLYLRANNATDGTNRPFRHDNLTSTTKVPYVFLQNSKYYMYTGYSTQPPDNILQPPPDTALSITYETGLVRPGIAPLDNLGGSTTSYGPLSVGTTSSQPMFLATREVSTNNTWFTPHLDAVGANPIEYCSIGKLICNGNDYRVTAHNIVSDNSSVLAANATPQFKIWSAEHNDYDGNPISIIGNPYYTGSTTNYGALVYNDVVNNTSVLVVQSSGSSSGDGQVWLPLELPVPTYSAGSDSLRLTVSAAYTDGGTNIYGESLYMKAFHRDTTQSNNYYYYTGSRYISAGGDPTSTTTGTLNLINVPTSGQEKITSVIVNLGLDFSNNAVIRKFYITNVAIETY